MSEVALTPLPRWAKVLRFLVIAFFLLGGIGNLVGVANVADEFARWGYPRWFHYVAGTLELATAVLLAVRSSRLWGVLLGAALMTAAAATLLWHAEYAHALAPLLVLACVSALGRAVWRCRPRAASAT